MKNILHILATTSLCALLPATSATCSQPRHDNNQQTVVVNAQQSANTRSVSMQKTDNKPTFRILEEWQVGKEVSVEDVRKYGTDRCFASMPISDAVFARQVIQEGLPRPTFLVALPSPPSLHTGRTHKARRDDLS